MNPEPSKSLAAVAQAVEDVAGRLSLATRPDDLERAVADLLTIAGNARSGVLDES